MNIGIVGLPNVGKSTIFKALTKKQTLIANYPFATIDPSVGIVDVLDPRVDKLADISQSLKKVYTTIEFVDIAGLVKGANEGEGLGNQFLSHIREVDAIGHVTRMFSDSEVIHVNGKIDPIEDLEVIIMELALADLSTVEKRLDKIMRERKSGASKEAERTIELLTKFKNLLEKGEILYLHIDSDEERILAKSLSLLTAKPFFVMLNTDEEKTQINDVEQKIITRFKCPVVPISAKIEAELADLSIDEVRMFMQDLEIKEQGLDRVIRTGYELLGLITYLTTGEPETKAWTIKKGMTAPQAAGVIHTDFEKLFITAEVTTYSDFVENNGWSGVRTAGKLRLEGKEYIVQDGDVCFFRIGK